MLDKQAIKLLREVKKEILANPDAFHMNFWTRPGEKLGRSCGTTGCIAGTTVALQVSRAALNMIPDSYLEATAMTMLRITPAQATRLFYAFKWPEPFRKQYEDNGDPYDSARRYDIALDAKIAARRIDHFIRTNGAS